MKRWLVCTVVLALAIALPIQCQTPSPRASLIQADQALASSTLKQGLAAALAPVLDDSAVILLAGAQPTSGKSRIDHLLLAQPRFQAVRMQWFPVIVAVSQDGRFGVTTGMTVLNTRNQPDSSSSYGHYITVWRRSGEGPWTVLALLENGVANPDSTVIPADQRANSGSLTVSEGARPFAQADLDFARLAADSGAPLAFGAWAAPDVTTPPGTGIMAIGPAQIRARIGGGAAANLPWEWHPVWGAAAGSGDLAATIGLSRIGTGDQAYIGKYLTIWRRQPDGSIRFILDSGNDRPK
jgi:ketosteroid isomerase-like protein